MDIREFFELCEGQWVSQRTLHHIQTEKTDVGKADLWIETLDPATPQVVEACQDFNLPIEQIFSPLEVTYKSTLENGRSQISSTLLIPVKNPDSETQGHLVSVPKQGDARLGSFSLGTDEVMTFTQQQGETTFSERIWYASENLRIRSITQTCGTETSEATFCSEIRRMGSTQPKPTEADLQQQSPLAAWRARQANQELSSN